MRGWWQEISGLVLPAACGGCGAPRTPLCEECAQELHGSATRLARPVPAPVGLPEVSVAAPYADAVRALLIAHKERGALGLARPLGVALAGAVRMAAATAGGTAGPLLLVPVPSARRAVRARGHDAVRRLALAAARELRRQGIEAWVLPALRQQRAIADQSGLTALQRAENLAGALGVVPGAWRLLAGGRTVLVDDVMTTGASLAEAARAIRSAGEAAGGEGSSRGGEASDTMQISMVEAARAASAGGLPQAPPQDALRSRGQAHSGGRGVSGPGSAWRPRTSEPAGRSDRRGWPVRPGQPGRPGPSAGPGPFGDRSTSWGMETRTEDDEAPPGSIGDGGLSAVPVTSSLRGGPFESAGEPWIARNRIETVETGALGGITQLCAAVVAAPSVPLK